MVPSSLASLGFTVVITPRTGRAIVLLLLGSLGLADGSSNRNQQSEHQKGTHKRHGSCLPGENGWNRQQKL